MGSEMCIRDRLHYAMLHRRWRVAQILLDAGADPNAEDIAGDRPLDYIPSWATFPDHPTYWKAVNRQVEVTKAIFEELLGIVSSD